LLPELRAGVRRPGAGAWILLLAAAPAAGCRGSSDPIAFEVRLQCRADAGDAGADAIGDRLPEAGEPAVDRGPEALAPGDGGPESRAPDASTDRLLDGPAGDALDRPGDRKGVDGSKEYPGPDLALSDRSASEPPAAEVPPEGPLPVPRTCDEYEVGCLAYVEVRAYREGRRQVLAQTCLEVARELPWPDAGPITFCAVQSLGRAIRVFESVPRGEVIELRVRGFRAGPDPDGETGCEQAASQVLFNGWSLGRIRATEGVVVTVGVDTCHTCPVGAN
jgi:hypothetical protein